MNCHEKTDQEDVNADPSNPLIPETPPIRRSAQGFHEVVADKGFSQREADSFTYKCNQKHTHTHTLQVKRFKSFIYTHSKPFKNTYMRTVEHNPIFFTQVWYILQKHKKKKIAKLTPFRIESNSQIERKRLYLPND